MGSPWERASGREYDLLRLLPPNEAREVWCRAFFKGRRRMIETWWAWPLLVLLGIPFLLGTAIFVWRVAAWLGGGVAARVAAEVVAHVLLVVVLHSLSKRFLPPLLRPFVWEELVLLVEQEGSLRPDAAVAAGQPNN